MEGFAQRIARLSPQQRATLESALFDAPAEPADKLEPRSRNDGPRYLSFAQERLWFIDQLQPGSATYNLPMTLPLGGAVELSAVQGAIDDLVGRHEILRSAIGLVEGKPVQRVAPTMSVPVGRIDLRDRPTALSEVVYAEVLRPFDLSTGPLLRASVVCLGDTNNHLLIVTHHIVSDGWSIGIVAREFTTLYAARCAGRPALLPPLPVQYADYAEWQRTRLAGPRGASLLAYWLDRLAGAPQVFALPSERRHAVHGEAAAAAQVSLLQTRSAAVRALARTENATSFIVLVSAFLALLHRFSRQDDILVGTPVTNRDQVEFEQLIGLFVNTLPLRSRIDRSTSFRALVRQMRATVLDAHANQDLPFEQLVSRFVSTRDATRPPLVQVLFAVENGPAAIGHAPANGQAANGHAPPPAGPVKTAAPKPKFELTLTVADTGDLLTALWEHSTGVYDYSTIAGLARAFDVLLSASLAAPDQPIDHLPLLAPDERERLLRPAGAIPSETGSPDTLYALVAAQARRTPDAVAIISDDARLSFAELVDRVDRLADRLHHLGVGPGECVGVCASRSPQVIVGLLAVLRLGGAYVPLDPDYPLDRLAYMAADAGLVLILAEHIHRERLAAAAPAAVPIHVLDTHWPSDDAADLVPAPQAAAHPHDIAYVIYTSGSTGRPKGVAIPHRAIVKQIRWFLDTWPLGSNDRVLQRTSLSFDASVWEIFAPLVAGATLVLQSRDRADITDLGEAIRRHEITVVQLVPSLLRVLLEHGSLDRCPSVRLLFSGGEALSAQLVKGVAAVGSATVVNLYGPTEATINATFHVVNGELGDVAVPIGRPAADLRTYALDERMEPVPPGAVGELYLGGVGLAWGYVGKPDLTAASFVPDPFGAEPGGRLYCTGDLVSYAPDGLLEFRGRRDHQVKVRGFRIELAEVERALLSLADVAAAVVEARDDRLIAWVVPRDSAVLSAKQLRASLGRLLPEYMIPAVYFPVAEIPLLPNGKADRKALPFAGVREIRPDGRAEPETETEQALAGMWKRLLETDPIGRHDDFFMLGGHSLLAVQVSSRVHDRFGITLPLRQIFETPTIAALSRYIDEAVAIARPPASSSSAPVLLSEAERRHLLERIDEIPEHQIDALLLTLADGARTDGGDEPGGLKR